MDAWRKRNVLFGRTDTGTQLVGWECWLVLMPSRCYARRTAPPKQGRCGGPGRQPGVARSSTLGVDLRAGQLHPLIMAFHSVPECTSGSGAIPGLPEWTIETRAGATGGSGPEPTSSRVQPDVAADAEVLDPSRRAVAKTTSRHHPLISTLIHTPLKQRNRRRARSVVAAGPGSKGMLRTAER
jgi:hypothetical protein